MVAPFRRQVTQIRLALRSRGCRDIRVGSVEDYQGQEEKIIIVSPVRASKKWLSQDCEIMQGNATCSLDSVTVSYFFFAGLMFNDRLFNVCITRPRNLLVVVGNPSILSLDPNWRKLLGTCLENG